MTESRGGIWVICAVSPEKLVVFLVAGTRAEEGIEWLDELRGDEAYKKLRHVETVPTFGGTIPRRSRAGELIAA